MTIFLPPTINVGGSELNIEFPETLNDCQLGQTSIAEGFIRIANKYYTDRGLLIQSDSSKENTFYHELTHAILGTMCNELNNDEEFVSTFSSFLCSAMQQVIRIEFTKNE